MIKAINPRSDLERKKNLFEYGYKEIVYEVIK